MKRVGLLITLLILVNVVALFFCLRQGNKAASTGFIDVPRLLDSYKLKKSLVKKVESKMTSNKNMLDSLKLQYSIAAPNSGRQNELGKAVMDLQYRMQNDQIIIDKTISEQVWNRLNPLIYQFSIDHKINILMGAMGNGNVLYGDSTLDYTNSLIQYINEK